MRPAIISFVVTTLAIQGLPDSCGFIIATAGFETRMDTNVLGKGMN